MGPPDPSPTRRQSAPIRASLQGSFSLVDQDGQHVELKSRKAKGLLAYLLCAPQRRRTREHLAGLFWGDSGEAHARSSLRQAVASLKRDLGDRQNAIITAGPDWLAVSATHIQTDVERISAGETPDHINDGFLEDLACLSEPFEEWRRCEAAQHLAFIEHLRERQIERARSAGDHFAVAAIATAMIRTNPVNERAWQDKFEAQARQGDTGAALATYRGCAAILETELRVGPSDSFQAAAARLAANGAPKSRRISPAEVPRRGEAQHHRAKAPLAIALSIGAAAIIAVGVTFIAAGDLINTSPALALSTVRESELPNYRPSLRRDLEPDWRRQTAAARPDLADAARACVADGEDTQAVIAACTTLIDALDNTDPMRSTALHARASASLWEGDYPSTLADAEAAFAADPSHYNALHLMAYAHQQSGNFAEAIAYYTRVREMQPRHLMAAFRSADGYMELGDFTSAVAAYSDAIELSPQSANLHIARALAHAANGDETSAERDFKKAASMDGTVRRHAEQLVVQMRDEPEADPALIIDR